MANEPKIYAMGEEALGFVVRQMTQTQRLGGPPSGGDGGTVARLAKLESCVEHIQTDIREIRSDVRDIRNDAKNDFRILFGAIILASMGLAGLMAKGFGWL